MWLLSAAVKQAIEQAQRDGVMPTAEQQARYEARLGMDEGAAPRILSIAGDTATISVSGVITKSPSFFAMLFGGGNVTYPEIVGALAEADKNEHVKQGVMKMDSPGGHVDGLFDALAAMEMFSKPLKVVVQNQAASAAYALAAQGDEIVAENRAVRVGGIGVAASFTAFDEKVDIASTKAPKKRPDVRTEEGKDIVREELDALHELFVEEIASGRNTTPDTVNAEFGQGATLLAEEALRRGMIDSIAATSLRVINSTKSTTTARSGGGNLETRPMDLKTLQAQHPDVYEAAVQHGVTQERDRVSAHLEMGEAANAFDIAVKAIKDGEDYTAKHMAVYNAAALRARDQQNRQDDDSAAGAADGAQSDGEGGDAADIVCSLVESKLGIAGE